MKSVHIAFIWSLISASIVACGGGEPPPKQVDATPTARPVSTGPKLRTSQELGSIDEDKVRATFNKLSADGGRFASCQASGLGRVEYLSGSVKFFLRIGEDGRAKYGYLEKSTLGDSETEKCLLDAAMSISWPQPDGGEAEVRYDGLAFDPPGGVRMPTEWPSDKVAATIGKHMGDFDKCTGSAKGAKFDVTAYVASGGKVESVGVATSTKDGAAQVDCIVSAVKSIKMPSPGSYAAKVAFSL